jgi:ubiquinone/menaquinone biosynthesis C-methylase UbiE
MIDQKQYWTEIAKYGPMASVIDPNDTVGHKNKYIVSIRDQAILNILPTDKKISLLDFGCGSGNLSKSLSGRCRKLVGMDISFELLKFAVQQNDPSMASFLQYDGKTIPLQNNLFDYAVTYVVLNHIIDDNHLTSALKEIHRVLSPQGKMICIEQTRKAGQLTDDDLKNQRSVEQFTKIFNLSGFHLEKVEFIRWARFPLVYAIRYGLIAAKHFETVAKLDKWYSSIFNKPRYSYVDTLFILRKGPN